MYMRLNGKAGREKGTEDRKDETMSELNELGEKNEGQGREEKRRKSRMVEIKK